MRAAALLLAGWALAAMPAQAELAPPIPAMRSHVIASPGEIVGGYIVGVFGSRVLGEDSVPFYVTIGESRIAVLAQCINIEWDYRFEGEGIVTTPVETGEPCRRALDPDERAIVDAFTGANDVNRWGPNNITFDGPGGSVTLFSQ